MAKVIMADRVQASRSALIFLRRLVAAPALSDVGAALCRDSCAMPRSDRGVKPLLQEEVMMTGTCDWLVRSNARSLPRGCQRTAAHCAPIRKPMRSLSVSTPERQLGDARFIEPAQTGFHHALVLFLGRFREWEIQ